MLSNQSYPPQSSSAGSYVSAPYHILNSTTPSSASQTPLLATSPDAQPLPKGRPRRSLSTDSYAVESGPMRELTAGQKKAAAEKKGSKHADIIDRWDPTGLGDAMWHHAGPYDAAAPSRNVNQTKGPMQVFSSTPAPAASTGSSNLASTAPTRKTTTIQENEHHSHPRAAPIVAALPPPAPARIPVNRRVSGGGLTGQYSTSVPSGGGYFPDAKQPQDEATLARLERERERDQKQRALKAAWGTDEPEPWEAFGASPNEELGHLGMDGLTADIVPAKPVRSPGLRLGGSRADSYGKEALPSPTNENAPISVADLPGAGSAGRPAAGGGVKRTKSLMQKFKTMRDGKSGIPFRSASPSKSVLPVSPSTEFPLQSPNERDEILYDTSNTNANPFTTPNKAQSQPQGRTVNLVPQPSQAGGAQFDDAVETIHADTPGGHVRSETEKEFVFVDSPNTKVRNQSSGGGGGRKGSSSPTRAKGIPPVPALPASISQRGGLLATESGAGGKSERSGNGKGNGEAFRPLDRVKYLPPPPVGQVMPDFADIEVHRRATTPDFGLGVEGQGTEGSGMRRKGSVVKKIRERIK